MVNVLDNAMLDLVAPLAQRFKVIRSIVRAVTVTMMNQQELRATTPFAGIFQVPAIVRRAAPIYPCSGFCSNGWVGSISAGTRTKLPTGSARNKRNTTMLTGDIVQGHVSLLHRLMCGAERAINALGTLILPRKE